MTCSETVLKGFRLSGEIRKISRIGSGHIHQSLKVETSVKSYFLQRINDSVFSDVPALMDNMSRILDHLDKTPDYPLENLTLVTTVDNSTYLEDNGQYWRCTEFKDNLISRDTPETADQVFEAARAFATFSDAFSRFPVDDLNIVILNFHSLRHRYNQLKSAVDPSTESPNLNPWLTRIDILYKKLLPLEEAWVSGELMSRVVHNDTKLNNVLFDSHGKACCVVDLDTVMPGIIHFDLGDGLRTTSSVTLEDDPNLDNVTVDTDRYKAFREGYLSGFSNLPITKEEKGFFNLAGPYMALIMGIRFLTDYLKGNKYYSIDYPHHNLDRARNQVVLTEQFISLHNI